LVTKELDLQAFFKPTAGLEPATPSLRGDAGGEQLALF
jgi:hypothetical protein